MANDGLGGQKRFVYDLPFMVRSNLCKLLNQQKNWEILADLMQYNGQIIDDIRREKNPTDELLEKWSHQNHTIEELFILISKVPHPQAMILLKAYVNQKYHHLISNESFKRLYPSEQGNPNCKDLKISMQNFNNISSTQANGEKVILSNQISKQLGTAKILNSPPQSSSAFLPRNSNDILALPSVPSPNILPASKAIAATTKINNESKFLANTSLPQISYEELRRATGGWSASKILGKGSFGTVFHGNWKHMNVAIKRIEQHGPHSLDNFLTQLQQSSRELEILNSYGHDNILSLYAYSLGSEAPCLVYQLMVNGSLEDRLLSKKKTKPLNWLQRHNIAKGTARGLQFLHTIGNKPLIHGNIKPANILLDNNFEPRIGDFALAREEPEQDNMKISHIYGSRAYLPDEFLQSGTLSTKIDTYSFGIVLLELATGLPAYDNGRPDYKFLKDFIASREPNHLHFLKDEKAGTAHEQVFGELVVLGQWCSNSLAEDRPEMQFLLSKFDGF